MTIKRALAALGLIFVALVVSAYIVGAKQAVYANTDRAHLWFTAYRGDTPPAVQQGFDPLWSSTADQHLIGAGEPYWTGFMILGRDDDDTGIPVVQGGLNDLYVAKISPTKPPKLVLGMLRLLYLIGVPGAPDGNILESLQGLPQANPFLPSRSNIDLLLARPATYQPHMVNFLKYQNEGGRDSYMKYGAVALRTVYSIGGELQLASQITRVVVPAKAGQAAQDWDDIAIMAYPDPSAIFLMEQVPAYHASLEDRDAGLSTTIVIASHR